MQRSKLAQNRIEYIVYGNPKGVSQLIYDLGYETPKGLQNILKATKLLVQKEGTPIISQLIKLHPDRATILGLEKPEEDSYCGACGHHNYDQKSSKGDFLDELVAMGSKELEQYYEKLLKKYQLNPDDQDLGAEILATWNELRERLKNGNEETNLNYSLPASKREGLLILSLTLLAGILVGVSLKKKTYA